MYCFSSLAEFAVLRDSIKEDLVRSLGKDAFCLFVAINEGVNNAILHGNKEETGKIIQLIIERLPDEIKIVIRDEGNGFCESDSSNPTEVWSEHGRGLELIKHYVDFYRFNSVGNELTLVKKINATIHNV